MPNIPLKMINIKVTFYILHDKQIKQKQLNVF